MQVKQDKIIVTGGAGFIGSNLCRYLLGQGEQVVAVDNLITGYQNNISDLAKKDGFDFFNIDINTPEFRQYFEKTEIKQIYHLACPTGVPNIKKLGEEMIQTCSLGTTNVMELARAKNAFVLYTSTAEIYGQPEVLPIPEDYNGNVNPLGPRSPYEEGKRFSESIAKMYVDKYGLAVKIVRIFNTYGPGMSLNDQRLIPQFLQAILSGSELVIYGDGQQTRTHLYIDDLIAGLVLVMNKGVSGEVYNIGGEKELAVADLARLMLDLAGRQNGVVYKPHFIEDHKRRQPEVSKVKKLGWQPKVTLSEGLKKMLEYYQSKQTLPGQEPSLLVTRGNAIV